MRSLSSKWNLSRATGLVPGAFRLLPLLLLGVIPVALLSSCSPNHIPKAVAGVLDLRQSDLTEDAVDLGGQWQLITGKSSAREGSFHVDSSIPRFTTLPSPWEAIRGDSGEKLGHATFRLVVLLDSASIDEIAIDAPAEQSSAYTLWVDGKPALQRGVVGATRETEVQESRHGMTTAPVHGTSLEIVLEASNHSLDYSGKILRFRIGERQMMERSHARWLVLYMGCMGILLIFAVQYLGFLAVVMRERTYLQFGAFCLLWLVACFCESGRFSFMTMLFPHVPFRFAMLATFASVAVSLLLVGQFCHSMFPNPILRIANRVHTAVTVVLVAMLFVCPFDWSFRIFAVVVGFGFLEVGVLTYSLVLAIRARSEGSLSFAVGYALFMLATAHDGLIFVGAIDSSYLMILGGTALAVAEAFALSKRFISVHLTNGKLLTEVQAKNSELGRLGRLKDDFMANTSHELRTPLHGIFGLAQNMLSDARVHLPEEIRKNLEHISASARRLTGLVNDILDFSKLRHRDIALNRASVDLASLLPSITPHFEHAARHKGLVLASEIHGDLPNVLADEDRLVQILFNLVGNAVKFTDSGSVTLSARLDGDAVEVAVTDTGIGIAPEALGRIFEPFEQGEEGYRGGTGLGLSITRKLVELHGSSLEVASEPGSGTCFRMRLPVSAEAATTKLRTEPSELRMPTDPAREPPPSLPDESMGENGVVLAIDDEPLNLLILHGLLGARGIRVVTAPDGRNAVGLIEMHDPAVVLLDVMMPHEDGYAVCARIRDRWTPNELPVLFLSARSRLEDLVDGFAVGGNDYVPKPFLGQELVARVEAQMRQRDAFVTQRENQALKVELAENVLERRHLETVKNRLLGMFHGMDDPTLVVDSNREPRFVNRAMARLLEEEPDRILAGIPPGGVLEGPWPPEFEQDGGTFHLRGKEGRIVEMAMRIFRFQAEDEHLWVLSGDPVNASPKDRSASRQMLQKLAQGERRIAQLKKRLDELEGGLDEESQLDEIHSTLSQIRLMVSEQPDKEQRLLLACEVMNDALALWNSSTGKGKADLAEESGLWAVHTDINGWRRPATLDKYLDPNKIPNYPKWKTIIKTVEFVKSTAPGSAAARALEEKTSRLQACL
jgi:two-component system, sensor histidine kinase ChiS